MSAAHMLPAILLLGGTIAVLGSPDVGAGAPIYLVGGLAIWGLWHYSGCSTSDQLGSTLSLSRRTAQSPQGGFLEGRGGRATAHDRWADLRGLCARPRWSGCPRARGMGAAHRRRLGINAIPSGVGWVWGQIEATRTPR